MWRRGIAVIVAATVVAGCKGESKAPVTDTSSTRAHRAHVLHERRPVSLRVERGRQRRHRDRREDRQRGRDARAGTAAARGAREPGREDAGRGGERIARRAGPGVDEKTLPPADRSKDGIALIDLSTGKKKANLPGGVDPESFAISGDGKTIYVSNEDGGSLTLIDVDSREDRGHGEDRLRAGGRADPIPTTRCSTRRTRGAARSPCSTSRSNKIIATIPDGEAPARNRVHARREEGVHHERGRRHRDRHRREARTRCSRTSRFRVRARSRWALRWRPMDRDSTSRRVVAARWR